MTASVPVDDWEAAAALVYPDAELAELAEQVGKFATYSYSGKDTRSPLRKETRAQWLREMFDAHVPPPEFWADPVAWTKEAVVRGQKQSRLWAEKKCLSDSVLRQMCPESFAGATSTWDEAGKITMTVHTLFLICPPGHTKEDWSGALATLAAEQMRLLDAKLREDPAFRERLHTFPNAAAAVIGLAQA